MNVKALAERKFELTWGMVWTVLLTALGGIGSVVGLIWVISGWQATNDLRVEKVEEAISVLQETVANDQNRLTVLESDSRNDRRILLRMEDKIDELRGQRFGQFPPN